MFASSIAASTVARAASSFESADYAGPERRGRSSPSVTAWFAATLDELDFGVVLLTGIHTLVHANHAARSQLDGRYPLHFEGGELRVRDAADAAAFGDALQAAAHRGLRKLLTLGGGGNGADRVAISVVPLQMAATAGPATTLVMLGKRRLAEGDALAIQAYARNFGLTGAESRVLDALGRGATPNEIAAELGVGIATVRTQIGSIRQKTGTDSIRALVQQVASLPPLVGVLRSNGAWASATRWPASAPRPAAG